MYMSTTRTDNLYVHVLYSVHLRTTHVYIILRLTCRPMTADMGTETSQPPET